MNTAACSCSRRAVADVFVANLVKVQLRISAERRSESEPIRTDFAAAHEWGAAIYVLRSDPATKSWHTHGLLISRDISRNARIRSTSELEHDC